MIAGPSGVGKGSVVGRLVALDPEGLALSVSVKTRDPRPGEVEGREYFFVSEPRFDEMIRDHELLEWAPFLDHRSGTPRRFVEEQLAAGKDVILEIDVDGARQIRSAAPDAILIFLAPPSMDELAARLRGRGTEDEARIEARLAHARDEMDERHRFDHVIVNDDLERASSQVAAIIESARPDRPGHPDAKDQSR